MVNKLWDLDSLGIREDNQVHENLVDNICFTGERYQVGLPWKIGNGDLPTNYEISLMRLQSQLRKLRNDPQTLIEYDKIIREQENMGIVERVSALEKVDSCHYLAHQAVIRENVETTKVRIVFDASCKASKSSTCLNDCLHVGPPMTPLIFKLLLRFRECNIALVGDIEKAFLNIEIDPSDRDYLRFLWVDSITEDQPTIAIFRFNRVVFGVNSSPFILNAVLRHHIERFKEVDPEFARKLVEGFYVDDLVTGCRSPIEAIELYEKAKDRMQHEGFRLRKWKSNDPMVLSKIKERESLNEEEKGELEETSFAKETLGISNDNGDKTKVLGVVWDTRRDTLEIELSKMLKEGEILLLRGGILSTLASLFDPLGIVSPIAVMPKVLFQDVCKEGVGWDEEISSEKVAIWKSWLQDLKEVGTIKVPRCVYDKSDGEILWCQLHGFGDARAKAYCATIYVVYETLKGIFSKLLCSKTRIAPLKSMTIPRLELMSARILAVLVSKLKNAIQAQVKIEKVRLWLDSKTALFWILNKKEWKQFVKHRVNEILTLTKKEEWGHVSGVQNPADLGSRGVPIKQLVQSDMWWEGPKWLKLGERAWPKGILLSDSEEVKEEQRKSTVLSIVTEKQQRLFNVIDIHRYSTLGKLIKVTAWVKRFTESLKRKREGSDLLLDPLSTDELNKAELALIKDAQIDLQQDVAFEKIRKNLDIRNQDDVLLCHGRLENSDLELGARFPVILPRDHKLTELIVWDCHNRVHHCKVRATLAEVRGRFWITRGLQYVKKILRACFICRKLEGKAYESPNMAPLPAFRVTEAPPFSSVGIDFAGPLYYKTQKGMRKCYIALFSCSVSRAVHLELAYDLSTPTFICCLRRFCAGRGVPLIVVSDNAKTFKAAARFLKKLKTDNDVRIFLDNKRINWVFNLERSPWWGGHFERMVGQVKRCLRKVIGNAKLSFDELNTVLSEIENTLNCRPLTYDYDEPGVEVLTPSHLIFGRRISSLSAGIDQRMKNDEDEDSPLSKRYLYLTRKLSHFWNRWHKEYLLGLREAHKSEKRGSPLIREGDIVLVQDENWKRGMWKTGIIEQLIVGKDGVTRGAKVSKPGKGKYEYICRPVQKLYPLEIARENVEVERKDGEESERGEEGKVAAQAQRPHRAAAKDAQWKTRFMLDSF